MPRQPRKPKPGLEAVDDLLSLAQAAFIYEVDQVQLAGRLYSKGVRGLAFMGRPVNPSGVGRPMVVYRREDIEAAIEDDTASMLDGSGGA